MKLVNKALIVCALASFGMWGCARPAGQAAQAERLKQLETKCGKLEDDYRSVAAARDQARKRLTALDEERNNLFKELEAAKLVAKERDELKGMFETRTTERDALQTRCERLKKGLQSLLGQDDALAPAGPTSPVTKGTPVSTSGKSL